MARGNWGIGGRRSGVALLFVIAITLRIVNGSTQLAPADELYHWKRMRFSAQHFPEALEFDRDRGVAGAFCPWPPLYDLSGGGVVRIFGAGAVVWIPPIAGAACVALAALWITSNFGTLAGITAGLALAASPFIVTQSSLGDIDHHFLEWPLAFAIMVATARRRPAIPLALAMLAAMFVQTALLIACALAFAVVFTTKKNAAGAFLATAVVIAVYRLTRAPAYPDSAWFLGWTHAALFLAATVAMWDGLQPVRRWLRLLLAISIALAAPSTLLEGLHFFGGDRWLRTIIEFQPMWRSRGADLLSQAVGLGAGAILVWVLAVQAIRRRDALRVTIALFAIVFLLLTISNRRFWSMSIPLLAIGGAVCAASIASRHLRLLAAAAVACIPAVQLAMWMRHPQPAVQRYQVPWIRAAEFLRRQPPGLVLAPWGLGHVIDVVGHHAVIIDNFGSMPDPVAFERAHDAFLARRDATMARYCDEWHLRYVVLSDPDFGLQDAAAILGVQVTPALARSTWWWRAYASEAMPNFRRIYAPDPAFAHAAVEIWEYTGGV